MTRIADTLIDQMVKAVVDEVDPEQVILFGSRARGEEQEDSDVDLVVVEAEPFGRERSRHKEMVRLYKVLANFPVSADILVYIPTTRSIIGATPSTTFCAGAAGREDPL